MTYWYFLYTPEKVKLPEKKSTYELIQVSHKNEIRKKSHQNKTMLSSLNAFDFLLKL